ncbi:MAG: cysteine--tRNA ligase [Chloroflexi bacterium]|nr:cysteine--tRNA ligase [Chloroflexota bacterium]
MRLFNQASGQLETFRPLGEPVTIYVCGITPYDTTHLGHVFTYLSFDVLIRYWEYLGYRVRYVQNVTDIDDDILRKAREVGEDWRELGNRWTRHFIEDMRELNVRPPDVYPRATDVIPQMFVAIQTLIDKGLGYVANGNVYYHVAADKGFGRVTHLPPEEWLPTANERGNHPDDPHKRDPLDFVLWQAQQPGEPSWESPWGRGRPGWHIECSTMAIEYLGKIIDVHGGGADLSFPHHECETAQACGITGEKLFARFWLHTAMVRYQGEKMSKSLGNLIWARDLLQKHTADAVRILTNRHPYNETWEYDERELAPADELAARLLRGIRAEGGRGAALDAADSVARFEQAMDDNLNTRVALDVLGELADRIVAAAQAGRDIGEAQATLRKLGTVFGLRLGGEIEPRVRQGWEAHYRRFL